MNFKKVKNSNEYGAFLQQKMGPTKYFLCQVASGLTFNDTMYQTNLQVIKRYEEMNQIAMKFKKQHLINDIEEISIKQNDYSQNMQQLKSQTETYPQKIQQVSKDVQDKKHKMYKINQAQKQKADHQKMVNLMIINKKAIQDNLNQLNSKKKGLQDQAQDLNLYEKAKSEAHISELHAIHQQINKQNQKLHEIQKSSAWGDWFKTGVRKTPWVGKKIVDTKSSKTQKQTKRLEDLKNQQNLKQNQFQKEKQSIQQKKSIFDNSKTVFEQNQKKIQNQLNQTDQQMLRLKNKYEDCASGLGSCSKEEILGQYKSQIFKRQKLQTEQERLKEQWIANKASYSLLNNQKSQRQTKVKKIDQAIKNKANIIKSIDEEKKQTKQRIKKRRIKKLNIPNSNAELIDNDDEYETESTYQRQLSLRSEPKQKSDRQNHQRGSFSLRSQEDEQKFEAIPEDKDVEQEEEHENENDNQNENEEIAVQLLSLNNFSQLLYTKLNAKIRRALNSQVLTLGQLRQLVQEIISLNDEEKELFQNHAHLVWDIWLKKRKLKHILNLLSQYIRQQKQFEENISQFGGGQAKTFTHLIQNDTVRDALLTMVNINLYQNQVTQQQSQNRQKIHVHPVQLIHQQPIQNSINEIHMHEGVYETALPFNLKLYPNQVLTNPALKEKWIKLLKLINSSCNQIFNQKLFKDTKIIEIVLFPHFQEIGELIVSALNRLGQEKQQDRLERLSSYSQYDRFESLSNRNKQERLERESNRSSASQRSIISRKSNISSSSRSSTESTNSIYSCVPTKSIGQEMQEIPNQQCLMNYLHWRGQNPGRSINNFDELTTALQENSVTSAINGALRQSDQSQQVRNNRIKHLIAFSNSARKVSELTGIFDDMKHMSILNVILKIFSTSSYDKAKLMAADIQKISDSAINVSHWWLILKRLKQSNKLNKDSMKQLAKWLKKTTNDNKQLIQLPISHILLELMLGFPEEMAGLTIKQSYQLLQCLRKLKAEGAVKPANTNEIIKRQIQHVQQGQLLTEEQYKILEWQEKLQAYAESWNVDLQRQVPLDKVVKNNIELMRSEI